MRKSAIATTLILIGSVVAICADLSKQGYMEFTSANDIRKALPNLNPSEFAKVIEGDSDGCLTKPSQTKPVTVDQIRTLRQLTNPTKINALLGNPYCETAKGFKWITESGKELNGKFDKILDYEFSTSKQNSLTNPKERSPKTTDGSADRSLQSRVPPSSTLTGREPIKAK